MSLSTEPAPPAASATPATPLGRVTAVLILSNVGFFIGVLTPLHLLLSLRLTTLAGDGATSAFGIVTGVGALVALLANPLAGRLSDLSSARLGRRRSFILVGSLTAAVVLVALAFTTEVWQVVALWCVAQALFNLQFAATNALLSDQVPPARRGGVSGLVGLTVALGPLAGLAVVTGLPADSPQQWIFAALAAAVFGVLAVALLRDPRRARSSSPGGRAGLLLLAKSYWIDPVRHPAFAWAWITRFLFSCTSAVGTYNAFFLLQRYEFTPETVGGMVLTMSFVGVLVLALTSGVTGFISDRVGRQKPFLVAAGLLAATSLTIYSLVPPLPVLLVAVVIGGLGSGLFLAVDLALCTRVLPRAEDVGKDLAIINIANSLPQSVVPFAAPLLLALGGFPALYLALAALGLLGILTVLPVPELGREHLVRRGIAPITRPVPTRH